MISINTIVSHRKDIDTTDLNGDLVMMDLEEGRYFSLNSVGSRIWQLIEEPIEVNKIIDSLLEEYDTNRNECEENVLEFLEKLNDSKIISIS
ncbi:lasso peptide biosynthesis PqqD family chaperone [Terrisporobacter vanillatitrophus]|uniref:lasso peptide biosynthesis PqqD family chaperone n=1 Tax=Terrisporobacter vanillatitrophus TaxID=3058402 RepID=UPI003365E862